MVDWKIGSGLRRILGISGGKSTAASREEVPTASPKGSGRSVPASEREAMWTDTVPVAGRKTLPPDPRIMQAIGLNHSFETAVADIVDNSLDAGAEKILIRFVRDGGRLIGLCVVDDGRGMDEPTIDRAMTVGGKRHYDNADLGHFGIGLKAASLGQARVLTVVSRPKAGRAVGRRWHIESAASGFECDVLDGDFCASALDRHWQFLTPQSGTLVMWTEVKSFPTVSHGNSIDRFVDDTVVRLRQHLGLVFHRIIAAGTVSMAVDVEDVGLGETGLLFPVDPIDPFGYLRSGRKNYPRTLSAPWQGGSLTLKCHVWPGRSNLPTFKLPSGRPEQFQGFFFYRNNRLLQHGGWNGAVHPEKELQLARVEIDISPQLASLFAMNAEKTRVEAAPQFASLVLAATDGTVGFVGYIEDARGAFRESQKRKRERPKVISPGRGFAKSVRTAISEEYDFIEGESLLTIKWEELGDDTFFEVDREAMQIRLNKRYRAAVLGGASPTPNDAPLVKALVYLLAEETFRGAFHGVKTRDNLAIWQSILTAAARAELK
jgi:hypothetical protein